MNAPFIKSTLYPVHRTEYQTSLFFSGEEGAYLKGGAYSKF